MQLRVKEFRFEISRLSKKRTQTLTKEEVLEVRLGYLPFNGVRDDFPYETIIYIQEIKEDMVTLVMFNESKVIRKEITLHINEETTYQHKGPRGLPFGYYYQIKLEENLNENK